MTPAEGQACTDRVGTFVTDVLAEARFEGMFVAEARGKGEGGDEAYAIEVGVGTGKVTVIEVGGSGEEWEAEIGSGGDHLAFQVELRDEGVKSGRWEAEGQKILFDDGTVWRKDPLR